MYNFTITMEIKDIQGNILFDVPITQSAVKTEELMKQYNITLSWNAVVNGVLPLGSYIEHEGIRYSLLEPYSPEQRDEATYEYRPVFQHPIMRLGKALFFFYTYSGGSIVSKELDWSLTDNPANFMSAICDAISNELGEEWSYEVASDLAVSASLSFSNTDIFSALNSIAGAFETEWWFDYANRVLYLSKASHGEAITLEVGQNIGVPQVTQSKEGYYTRFYGFGSTRNIDQSYAGANVNSIVNRRLTLDPAKYPNGYIDIREGLTQEEVLSLPLVFDDIYPRSSLTISDVKVRLMWRLDDNSQKIQIGTDSEGNPVYDQYAIWYFKVPGFTFSKDLLISGKALSAHFNSGPLNGREFELTYHEKGETLSNSDGTDFVVEAGDYEINFVEEGTFIIPAITGLAPVDGNSITLFNIIMPEEYKASAYAELEEAVRKRMAQQEEDRNNYSFESNKVAFYESNPNLSIGRLVTFVNGSNSISTRVIKLETQLDYPFEQRITVGNAIIKGSQQTLKEEVVNANQNIDLLASINESTEAFQQALQRTQKLMQENMAADLLERVNVGTEENPVYSVIPKPYKGQPVGIISDTFITAGGRKGSDSSPGSATTLGGLNNVDTAADDVQTEDVVLVKAANATHWTLRALSTLGLNKTELESYLATNSYLKKDAADGLYAPLATFNELNTKFNDFLTGSDTDSIINKWKELEAFLSGQTEASTLADLLIVKADKTALQAHIDNYNYFVGTTYAAHIAAYNTHIAEYNTFKTDIQRRLEALEALWAIDEDNNGLYPKSGRGIWSESYITAGGVGNSAGAGGLIQTVYGYSALGGTFDNTNLTDTFNAYTINQLYVSGESIKDRVEVLEANMGVINPDTLLSLNDYIAGNSARITSLEDWIENPTAETAYFNELGVRDKLNVSGSATFDERITGVITEAINLTGTPEIKITGNTIAVLVGEKTSVYITVPYADKALNDSNGNSIIGTYARKADVNSLASTLADHLARIISIEDVLVYPSFDTLYINELGVRDKLNVAGPTTFDSSVTADVFTGVATKAIADKNNNDITTTYALKLEIGAAIEKLAKLNDNITSIEEWMVNASLETLLTRELGVLDKLNVSGAATFDDIVKITGNTTVGALAASSLNVSGAAIFTGKTTHNGGIGATTGTFSSTLSAGATTVSSLTSNGNISATNNTILGYTGRFFEVMPRTDGSSGVYNLGSSDNRWTAYLKSADVTGNIRLKPSGANYGNYLYFGDGAYCYIAELSDNKMTIYATSGLQITANTNVTGDIYATGDITAGSDARYKSKLQDVAVDVEVIANAPLFDYRWIDGREDNRTHLGTTAQYWAETNFRNAVIPTDNEKLWTMSYSQIAMGNTIVLARELLPIKRKVSEIDNLKDKLHRAEKRIELLETELKQYRRA